MKKIRILFLVLLFLTLPFTLVACKSENDDTSKNTYNGIEYDEAFSSHHRGSYTYYIFDYDTMTGYRISVQPNHPYREFKIELEWIDKSEKIFYIIEEQFDKKEEYCIKDDSLSRYPRYYDSLLHSSKSVSSVVEMLENK